MGLDYLGLKVKGTITGEGRINRTGAEAAKGPVAITLPAVS